MFSRSSSSSPPSFPGYHCVGWVKSAHGIRGELYVQLYARKADWLDSFTDIYLLAAGATQLKAWPVDVCRPHKEGLILKLKGVDDRNLSETMRKSGAYIREEQLEARADDGIFLKQILNFTLLAPDERVLGQIVGFASNVAQDLLRIQRPQGGEALVPFVEAFLVNIDFDKQTVKMNLPQGLIDLEDE